MLLIFVSLEIKKKQILYINAYMWNLEKQYRGKYLQGRNRDADTENRQQMWTKGGYQKVE